MSDATLAPPHAGNHAGNTTHALLGALALSGPLWAVVSLLQVATRDGFDFTRPPLSMLSVGSLGWLQITNFVVAGLLAVIGAVGLKRAVPSTWVPRLVVVYGIGYVLAGVFVMEPADGFPAGTPLGHSGVLAWHTIVHLLVGTIAFVALTAVLFVFGRYFARLGERGWAWGSRIAATGVIVADVASMAQVPENSAVLAVGIIAACLCCRSSP
jgi:hypothetical protein